MDFKNRRRRGFSLIEVMIVAGIITSLCAWGYYRSMKDQGAATSEKVAEIIKSTADGKAALCSIDPNGISELSTNTDDERWLLVAPYMQLTPATAITNRFLLLQGIGGSYTNFTVGNAYTAPTIN